MKRIEIFYSERTADNNSPIDLLQYLENEFNNGDIRVFMRQRKATETEKKRWRPQLRR